MRTDAEKLKFFSFTASSRKREGGEHSKKTLTIYGSRQEKRDKCESTLIHYGANGATIFRAFKRLPLKNKQRFITEVTGWKAKNAVRLKVNMLVKLGKKQRKIPFKMQQNSTEYV